MAGTLIVAESDEGRLRPEFWELVTAGRALSAAAPGGLAVALLGSSAGSAAEDARGAGAAEVHLVEDEKLAEPWPEAHAEALAELCSELTPEVVILPRTVLGSEVAARLAIRLACPLIQDAVDIELDGRGLRARRPVFGGAVLATVYATAQPSVVVPRPHVFPAAEPSGGAPCPLVRHRPSFAAELRTQCGPRTRYATTGVDIERASVIIAGGAGLGGPEPFELLREVADLLGGAVAASRPACDAGWVDSALQVGLTGKTVAPELYMAVGISGAIQHLMGCSSSQVIVAVNTDPAAPILNVANYGVVGDWREVIPAFRDALRARQHQLSGVL